MSPPLPKRAVASLATSRLLRPLFRPLMAGQVTVFMLHRFADAQLGTPGHDPERLRAVLGRLRKERVPLLSLDEVVTGIGRGERLEGVVFTVDDGYHDFASYGEAAFRAFDCPVTVFISTGFVDGLYWFWWDRIRFALQRFPAGELRLPPRLGGRTLPLRSDRDCEAALNAVVYAVKALPQPDRQAEVEAVIAGTGVEVPHGPPAGYQPMSWDQMRRLSAQGVAFAPHGVTHPSMATIEPSEVRREVRVSMERLREERVAPAPVFCYPYGKAADVSEEAGRAVAAEGLRGAVTALPGYIPSTASNPMLLPRFAFPGNELELAQILYGVERFKMLVRAVGRR